MLSVVDYFLRRRTISSPWQDTAPVRQEIFGVERLEQHAACLAVDQPVTTRPPQVAALHMRLNDNAGALLKAYRACAAELERGLDVVPAAEWFLDNYHLVEAQIREIRNDLPPGYYRQLPKLADGPFAGFPRVLGITWALVAHTDSHFNPGILRRFIAAYQRIQPLTIGELWAVPITLRIVLIENLRRLADQITAGQAARADADALANRLLVSGDARSALEADIMTRSSESLSTTFAAQLAKRLRDQDPKVTPALGWLEERLGLQGQTVDGAVQHEQRSRGASNVSVRSVITSMRLISEIDWAEWFESVSLVDRRLCAESAFATMDFPTRNSYRSAIEELARGSPCTELEVTERVLNAARRAALGLVDAAEAERVADPGYYLIARGRRALERTIGFRPPVRLWLTRRGRRLGIGGYVGAILLTTLALLFLAMWALSLTGLAPGWRTLFALAAFLPASETAAALVNRAITWGFGALTLPGLDLTDGVPRSFRTLVAVPTLLTNEADILEQVERLEVHYLAGAGGELTFALLSDWVDADQEVLPNDAPLLAIASAAIGRLNRRYGPGAGGARFLLLHRRRVFNAGENQWMGWERKRGKLHELNRLLRGASDTTFLSGAGCTSWVPSDVRYVIALDADTRLPRDAAARLIGKMAHPLNRPVFCAFEQRVIEGYAILQPRVTPSLPVGREGSLFQRVFSGPGGIDPYAAAVSDVYQDLFGEGSYTGKGIYDVDAFEAALSGRVPENALLSHDLFEGIFARAGLATDVELVEEFPSRYDVAGKRQHRWTRGDWQLLPWIFGRSTARGSLPSIGCWKMLDNLRRSLVAPFTLLAFGLCMLLPAPAAVVGVLLVLVAMATPAFLSTFFSALPRRAGIRLGRHLRMLGADLYLAATQTALTLVFLADRAWCMGDAIVRTLVRLALTRRHLLEWTTAAQATASPRLDYRGFYRQMAGGTSFGLCLTVAIIGFAPEAWPLAAPFGLLWLSAPALALRASRSPAVARRLVVSDPDARYLRLTARRTWRYFETFVTAAENNLPPDNFQEDPTPLVARRTSPTNLGLYLLSAVAARDFGWAGTGQTVARLEATLASMQRLPRFRGHFFNWYGTQDLKVLDPAYVSSVDSGNLAGHLLVLANTCEEWITAPVSPNARRGMVDNLRLAAEALEAMPGASRDCGRRIAADFAELGALLDGPQAIEKLTPTLQRLSEKAARAISSIASAVEDEGMIDLIFWVEAFRESVAEHDLDRQQSSGASLSLGTRLAALADAARALAMGMDFAFLLDPERKLLSIGYSLADSSLDPGCYDLLASEARLASLIAVAKGDAATRHWFQLNRTATPLGNASALLSWSGSMFEYLMPSLVLRAPAGSLLEQTNRLVVARQQAYARTLGIPWGISESAYNARDIELTYQYSNFGVPGLGLKRGLSDDLVIAPYATGLATMVDPHGARKNYDRLAALGAAGRYGFYEAADFTPARLPEGKAFAVVRCFMAHHQGMTIVAIANALHDGEMRARFHREPMIQAAELLLQERVPRDVSVDHPRVEQVPLSPLDVRAGVPTVRRLTASGDSAPITHLLSNGRYAVMLTAAGAGYSRWRDLAVTRWREDPTADSSGSFIFLRDMGSGEVWSVCRQPMGASAAQAQTVFGEDHARFQCRNGTLTTTMDVLVSGEDDGEVRRVSLVNGGRDPREIEFTSYAELVLTTPAADDAHPAFAKMFVQTEYLAGYGALVATRRPRSPEEPRVWAAHFAVVEGEIVAEPQFESDRAQFLGRGRTPGTAMAMSEGRELSSTIGTVLDPVFSLRYRLAIAPGDVARVAFWTVVAPTRAELLSLIDKHHDRNAFDRAKTLAWTQAQVQLRHLGIDAEQATAFQRLAAPILYADARFRASSQTILRGAGPQSDLWPHAISGDLPIILLRIDDIEDIARVQELLRAHEYWHMKRLDVDLVIVNERASSYTQDLQTAIETAVRSSQSRPRLGADFARGAVYVLRADLVSGSVRVLLQSVARVVLLARHGSIATQIALKSAAPVQPSPVRSAAPPAPWPSDNPFRARPPLEFFNGLGGFAADGREYVTVLEAGVTTPAPWINVIANPAFGFQVAAEGSGYTWAENSRENQLTPWSNDPVSDPAGEAIYIRDEETLDLWSPTAQPIRNGGSYISHHGFGYSRFRHEANGIALDLLQYVPLADPIKISRLTVRNDSERTRRLTVTAYTEWVLGTSRGASAPFIATELDGISGAMLARNRWSSDFGDRVAFADLRGQHTACTADRSEFLGRNGSLGAPAALLGVMPLSGRTGAGLDPCAALQQVVEIGAGETVEVVSFLGQCGSVTEARALLARYRENDLDAILGQVRDYWDGLLGTIQIRTPDRAMDIMLNGWLLYQTLACRIWARSALYQASGAYGFRDQLQDGMALTLASPQQTRAHLLVAAARQFVEGDVQHWWQPHSGRGVRTRISDDRVWLAFATATYVACTDDTEILDELVPFLDGPVLGSREHDSFFRPTISDESVSLFEHCARGIDQAIELTGEHGLPLMGTGDWNDGMNRVGESGRGESVWLGWLLLRAIELLAPLAAAPDDARVTRWRAHAVEVREAIEREAWDGAWYRRATYDDGTWLGTEQSEECRIDSIAQSWAVLSGAASPARATQAMASMDTHLVRHEDGLALLFAPPFEKTAQDPGYIKGYPPGLRENGGQYSHAVMWAILAYAKLGDGESAAKLFALVNPINHAGTPAQVERYKVEPYVVAADLYSTPPHVGRGGWTWYTGSAGWMYRAGVEGILGIRREGGTLLVAPCIPDTWPGFEATVNVASTRYQIRVENPSGRARHDSCTVLDGSRIPVEEGCVRVPLDGRTHSLLVNVKFPSDQPLGPHVRRGSSQAPM